MLCRKSDVVSRWNSFIDFHVLSIRKVTTFSISVKLQVWSKFNAFALFAVKLGGQARESFGAHEGAKEKIVSTRMSQNAESENACNQLNDMAERD